VVGQKVEWEVSMLAGTKMHFMVDGTANYDMVCSARGGWVELRMGGCRL
jgi:hypothetical protein